MDNITFQTPSGYTVHLKPFLTFGDKRSLERVFAEGMTVDATKGVSQASGKAIFDAQAKAVELMIVKLEMGDQVIEGPQIPQAIDGMRIEDGQAIYDKINELSTPQEKKGGSK